MTTPQDGSATNPEIGVNPAVCLSLGLVRLCREDFVVKVLSVAGLQRLPWAYLEGTLSARLPFCAEEEGVRHLALVKSVCELILVGDEEHPDPSVQQGRDYLP